MTVVRKTLWLLTPFGRRFAFKAAAAVSVSTFCIKVAPHTILLPYKRSRDEEAMMKTCGSKQLPTDVQAYVSKAIDELKLSDEQRNALTVFLSKASAMGSYGTVDSIFGANVLLPLHLWSQYPVKKTESAGRDEAEKEAYERLKSSLAWSEKCKLFATAQEIAWTTRNPFLFQSIYGALTTLSALLCAYLATKKVTKQTTSGRALLMINTIIFTMFYVIYAFVVDITTCDAEEAALKEVCNLGEEYAEGAKEYYSKLREHNLAARQLLGAPGVLAFSESGDPRAFRKKTLTLDERMAMIQMVMDGF